ncbi:hypothetical protein M8A51_10525 [Schlegelella sp. S2-27]|uniref:Uncharacterized protein n=1 Tax=Caldimonas mangrovi TaxID=2944811 RepID=A0ABT0YNX3_9BURK|nr:hypothetical protein [Caldimonas mangrovi]MCM5679967.1 hypothetical protein [Caldimonas mangrovi]
MNVATETNNDRLRALVAALDLPQAVLLTLFNRGLGPRACTASVWRAWLEPAQSARHVPLSDEMWQHAVLRLGALTTATASDNEARPEMASA